MKMIFTVVAFLFFSTLTFARTLPDPQWSPGVVCTANDPDYSGTDYPEQIARCNRNVSRQEKMTVAKHYGNIPENEWSQYEFDHIIPLCAGGSNSVHNIFPQPIAEAHDKDKVEDLVCREMKAGSMTQAQALQKIRDWFRGQYQIDIGTED